MTKAPASLDRYEQTDLRTLVAHRHALRADDLVSDAYAAFESSPVEFLANIDQLQKQQRELNRRHAQMIRELDMARDLQMSMLPGPVMLSAERDAPGAGHPFGFAYRYQPAGTVSGDLYLLYTDGLFEAVNRENEEFGQDRLLRTFGRYAACAPDELMDRILGEVRAFVAPRPFVDDICMAGLICR